MRPGIVPLAARVLHHRQMTKAKRPRNERAVRTRFHLFVGVRFIVHAVNELYDADESRNLSKSGVINAFWCGLQPLLYSKESTITNSLNPAPNPPNPTDSVERHHV